MGGHHWKLKDTVYLEPSWYELEFFLSHHGDSDGYRYRDLKKAHEAILLRKGCGLVAVRVTPSREGDRKEVADDDRKCYQTFEDAVEAVASRVQEQIVRDRDQVVGTLVGIAHYRKLAAETSEETP